MISFKCLTYGRVAFLEEALNSFLLQEDNDAELVIINDYPAQKLVFDHPQVRIINLDRTFNTIGKKENFAIGQCEGDIIVTFDDDDIALPWHLKNIKKYFVPGTNILHWRKGAYYNHPNITSLTDLGNSGMVFSKDAWERARRSPISNAGGDSTFRENVHKLGNIVNAIPPDEEVSWFYRWYLPQNGGCYHQSGQGTDSSDRPNIITRHSAHVEGLRQKGIIPVGEVLLNPHWDQDYVQLLADFVKNEKGPE